MPEYNIMIYILNTNIGIESCSLIYCLLFATYHRSTQAQLLIEADIVSVDDPELVIVIKG